jgi:hypothetical protein
MWKWQLALALILGSRLWISAHEMTQLDFSWTLPFAFSISSKAVWKISATDYNKRTKIINMGAVCLT